MDQAIDIYSIFYAILLYPDLDYMVKPGRMLCSLPQPALQHVHCRTSDLERLVDIRTCRTNSTAAETIKASISIQRNELPLHRVLTLSPTKKSKDFPGPARKIKEKSKIFQEAWAGTLILAFWLLRSFASAA